MSEQFNALLVDMGNTRIKYVLANDTNMIDCVHSCDDILALSVHLEFVEQVIVSSVGHLTDEQALNALCVQKNKQVRFIATQPQAFNIQCAYKNFKTFGVDRWLAMLASRLITDLPVAVIDLGTANTCDVLQKNQHLGGWIAPGISLMRDSLLKNTAKVFADHKIQSELLVGENTEDCVSFGCFASQMGFVVMAEQYLTARFDSYLLLITGGSQNNLLNYKNSTYNDLIL